MTENSLYNDIVPAKRVTQVSEYYFSRKLKEVAQMNAEGKDIISLAIGSPDMPPSEATIQRLCQVAWLPAHHGHTRTEACHGLALQTVVWRGP